MFVTEVPRVSRSSNWSPPIQSQPPWSSVWRDTSLSSLTRRHSSLSKCTLTLNSELSTCHRPSLLFRDTSVSLDKEERGPRVTHDRHLTRVPVSPLTLTVPGTRGPRVKPLYTCWVASCVSRVPGGGRTPEVLLLSRKGCLSRRRPIESLPTDSVVVPSDYWRASLKSTLRRDRLTQTVLKAL